MADPGIELLMQQGRWDDAESACRAALASNPVNAKLHGYLGLCLYHKSAFEQASESFKRATMLDPNFVDAAVKYAQCLDRLRRYEEAYAIAREWIKVRPSDRTLQGLINGLQFHVKGNRQDGWERTAHYAHRIILAQDEE